MSKAINHLEKLIKDNWESLKGCKTPIDQIVLSKTNGASPALNQPENFRILK